MPGISLWLQRADPAARSDGGLSAGAVGAVETRFQDALASVEHFEDYEREVLVERPDLTVASTAYPSYPVRTVESDEYLVCFEGRRYGAALDRAELLAVAERAVDGDGAWVGDWVGSTDGDYVVYALDKETGALAVVTDAFGRLPLYVAEREDGVLITRETGVVREFLDLSMDDVGVAQCLAFGFTLGERTVWAGVDKLDGGTLLRCESDGTVRRERVHEFDFGRTDRAGHSVEENAAAAAREFEAACRRRADACERTVVSLSGGHDSRAVAAGVRSAGASFSTATFATADRSNAADVEVARETADALGVDWRRFDLRPADADDLRTLLALKGGMNPFTNATTIEFFERLREEFGTEFAYLTGDGGDKAVPDLSPSRSLDDVDDLVDYLVEKETIVFPIERAVALTGVSEARLRETVAERMRSYPESDPAAKYVGYKVRERGWNWLNEGEDRNRAFFWSTTPFYSLPFFRTAMSVPPEQKANNRFYRAFLEELWPGGTRIDDANFHVPMASPLYRAVQRGLSFLGAHPRLEDAVRQVYRRELFDEYDESVAHLLLAQLRECDALAEQFTEAEVTRIAADRRSCNGQQAYNLLTMTSAVADVACDDPAFDVVEGAEFP